MARESSLTRQTILILVLVGIGLLLCGRWVYQRYFQAEEERVRAVIEAMAEGIRDKNAGDVLDHFSADYRGKPEKRAIHGFLVREFLRQESIECRVPGPIRVDLSADDTRATAHFEAFVAGLASGRLRGYEVEMELHNEDGTWRMVDYTARGIAGGDEARLE